MDIQSQKTIQWIVNFCQKLFRKHRRCLHLYAGFMCLLYLYTSLLNTTPQIPRFEIVKSSYDWSQFRFFHPISSPEPLPTTRPHKLPKIQHSTRRLFGPGEVAQKDRQMVVKETLLKSWRSYKQYAWMRDELTPVTAGAKDTFGGWAATAVDALDTLWIMGLKTEFYEAVDAVTKLDWSRINGTSCNLFETTIRHLGGLLSAYDLSRTPALLDKAAELGDMLYSAFDTPNHMPPFWLNFENAKNGLQVADDHQASASAASLSLEFTRLAQLTGNDKYYDAVARVTDLLYEYQGDSMVPGIWPAYFDLRNSNFTSYNSFTLGAASDSMYEYLLKMHLLLGGAEPKYEEMYRMAADTLIETMLFRPWTPDNLDILFAGTLNYYNDLYLQPEGQHLACFAGGMFAMGGKLFNLPDHVEVGAQLTKGCIWAYDSFPTGIMPEVFGLVNCGRPENCTWDEEQWQNLLADNRLQDDLPPGFLHARDSRYLLRPEALESVFILYRITGDEEYREAAWRMFQHVLAATETEYGNSAISDVTQRDPLKLDSQESFWLAETLKYAYLTFSSSNEISLDDYVFNTECHPFKIPKK